VHWADLHEFDGYVSGTEDGKKLAISKKKIAAEPAKPAKRSHHKALPVAE